jgi:hypothetical protein
MRASRAVAMTAGPRPHVCLVTETYAPEINGVALTLHRLVEGLGDHSHEVSIIRPRPVRANPDRVPFERADAPGKGNCDKGATTTGHLALIITGGPIRSVHGSDLFGWRLVRLTMGSMHEGSATARPSTTSTPMRRLSKLEVAVEGSPASRVVDRVEDALDRFADPSPHLDAHTDVGPPDERPTS